VALQVLVVDDLGGSATDVGLVNAARWAPYLLVGLLDSPASASPTSSPPALTTWLARSRASRTW